MTEKSNLTKGTISGIKWTYGSMLLGASLQLIHTGVMGRLLGPVEFGLLAMAHVVLRFGTYFAQMGVGQAVIQKPELTERDVRASFTSTLALGFLFAALFTASAPVAAHMFDNSDVVPIVRVLALTFLLDGLGRTATSLLRRNMRFSTLARIEITTQVVGVMGVGITMAVLGFGVWSLVGAAIAQASLQAILAFVSARHSLRPLLALKELGGLYRFGGQVSVIGFVEYITGHMAVFFLGRFAGSAALGHYNRAYLIVTLPLQEFTRALSRVLFPTFSRIQQDRARLRGAYLSATAVLAGIVFPTAAGIAVAAPELVRVVIGPDWGQAAAILPFLAVAAASKIVTHLAGVTAEATATLGWKLILQVTCGLLLAGMLSFAVVTNAGLAVYAAAVAVFELVRQGGYMLLMGRVLGARAADYRAIYLPPILTAAAVVIVMSGLSGLLRGVGAAPILTLAVQILTGASVVALALTWGPLAAVRVDVTRRLTVAGVLDGPSLPVRTLRRLGAAGRTPKRPLVSLGR